jgi:hypothetical protein
VTIHHALRRIGFTRKKDVTSHEQDRPDVAQERRALVWQRYMDASRFVFLDETGTVTNMTRRYGRCPRSERLVDDHLLGADQCRQKR